MMASAPTLKGSITEKMRRFVIQRLAILAIVVVSVCLSGFAWYRSRVRANGLEAAQRWARMSPLPATASGIHIETRGGPFTSEFTIRFTASSADIQSWIEQSPGTSKMEPVVKGPTQIYTIEPGAGAMHAEVTVDDDTNQVVIHTYWS